MTAVAAGDDGLDPLLDHLRDTRGVDLSGYKRTGLARRIRKRMDAVRATTFADYQVHLDGDDGEFAALFDTVLINVTSFFRDPDTWQLVADDVIPRLLDERPADAAVRVWVAGCATGEEAYTVAVLLCEAMGDTRFQAHVKIYATDADADALATARFARYPHAALSEAMPADLLDRYFEPDGNQAVFRSDLRRSVIFGRHDLVRDPPISRIDLLSCRNTLMYFTSQAQTEILQRLHFALRPSGYLVLGRSEALATRSDLFKPHDLKRRVFRRLPSVKEVRVPKDGEAPDASVRAVVGDGSVAMRSSVFDVSPIPQVVVDPEGSVRAVNQQARHLFGLGDGDVGSPLQDLEMSYRPLELRAHVDTVITERHALTVRGVEWQRGESRQWFDVSFQPLMAPTGVLEGTVVAFTPVTAQRQLQDDLNQSRLDLETAYEELQSAVEELETTNEELQSTNEELETTNEELQSTNEELETTNEELQSTNEELATINDELRLRSVELDEVNVFLEAILTSLQSAVVVVDRDVRVRVWNRRAQDLWGLRSEEVEGEHLMNLDIGLPVEHLRQAIRASLAGDETDEVVLDAVNRRGRTICCRVRACPLRGAPDGESLGVVLVMDTDDRDAGPSMPAS